MRKRLSIAAGLLAVAVSSVFVATQSAHASVGLHVSGTNVVEANGSTFVMRGTSHAHTWFQSQTSSFANIRALGANTIRVVLSNGRWGTTDGASDVANVIALCKANKMICVLEDHDTTGYGEQSGAVSLASAVSYWTSLKSVLQGQESYVVINIGNEPYGNNNTSGWVTDTVNAVKAMRSAGFEHMLMVDAPNWGQDWSGTMRDNAATVAAADPNKNTLFSVHMYEIYGSSSAVTSYVSAFKSKGLPLIIGEFGWTHGGSDVDEDTIMAQSIGWLGWSWSGNGGSDANLDQVTNFDPSQLTWWGNRLFNGTNGMKSTAKVASVYGGATTSPSASKTASSSPSPSKSPSSSPSASKTPSSAPPSSGSAGGCSASYAVTGQWPDGFQGAVTVTAGSSAINGWTVTWTFANGQTVSSFWSANITSSGSKVTATNVSYNGSLAAGTTASFGFLGSWNNSTNSTPSVSCTAS